MMISVKQINQLIELLDTGHPDQTTGDYPIPVFGEVLINMAKRIVALEKAAAERRHGSAINTTPFNDQGEIEYLDDPVAQARCILHDYARLRDLERNG